MKPGLKGSIWYAKLAFHEDAYWRIGLLHHQERMLRKQQNGPLF
jgi:hypothetical protein